MPEVRRRSRQRDEYNRACTAATREPVQEQPGAMLWRHSIYIPERSIAYASELTEQPESRNREGLCCGDIPYPEEIPGLPVLLGRNREGLCCGDIPYPEEIPGLPVLLGRTHLQSRADTEELRCLS